MVSAAHPPLMRKLLLPVLLVFLALGSTVFAAAPTAPSNLTISHSLVDTATRTWRFDWNDNSTTEDGFTFNYEWFDGQSWHSDSIGSLPSGAVEKAYTGPRSISVKFNSLAFAYFSNNNYYGYRVVWHVVAYKNDPTETSARSNQPDFSAPVNRTVTLQVPGNFNVQASGDGSFLVTFTDNSTSEEYFQLDYKKSTDTIWQATALNFNTTSVEVGGYQPRSYGADGVEDPVDDPTPDDELMFLPNFMPNTSYDFRMRAVGFDPDEAGTQYTAPVSGYTSTLTRTTQAFKAPSALTATRVGENTFDLKFTNNSTAESGYHFQYRVAGSSSWLELGKVDNPLFSNQINTGPVNPNTTYEFQVRGYIRGSHNAAVEPILYTTFSNTATGSTIFTAPTNLTATSPSEGLINLAWTDNSSAEGNFEILVRVQNTTEWSSYTYVNANTTSLTNQLVAPGKVLEFQVRATYGSQGEVKSAVTNTATVSTTFNAPTNFTATASPTDPYHISFAWTDNSAVESDYELQYRKQNEANFVTRKLIASNGAPAPNSMSLANLPEFDPGSVYEFQLRAVVVGGSGSVVSGSSFTPIATTATLNGFSSKPYAPITMGQPFSYQLTTISQQTRSDWSVGTLPDGLSFDSATGLISGTPTVAGSFTVPLTANFTGGSSHVLNLALRIVRPSAAPQIAQAIGDQLLAPGMDTTIDLSTKFSDLDTDAVVRMSTNKGDLDIVLYSTLTPGTVNNFLSYNYANTIFHRAPTNFVMQGGGYTTYEGPDVFDSVARQAPIVNEPGISNLSGTIAMAKVGDDPNSATSEFFFSLGNNSLNLDNQNGGFTVFGRLSAGSISVLNSMGSLPTTSYAVKLRTQDTTPAYANFVFSDIPVDQSPAPTSIDQTKLLKVLSTTSVPILHYAVVTPPDGAVATATITGTSLQIHAVAIGSTTMTVKATDVDSNVTEQTVNISVTQAGATITLNSATLEQTYDGTPRVVTTTTNPAGLNVNVSYNGSSEAPTAAGSYTVVATINHASYTGTASGTLTVAKAPATITLGALSHTYNGSPKAATATTSPTGLPVQVMYTNATYGPSTAPPSAHGSYTVEATLNDDNHTSDTQTGTMVIRGEDVVAWRAEHFTPQQITAGLDADDADPDGDGLSNLAEYALGTNPVAPTPGMSAPVRDANGVWMTFTRPKDLPGVIYAAQSSDDMVNWNPLVLEIIAEGPVQTVRVLDSLSAGNPARRFIRLLFQVPPAN